MLIRILFALSVISAVCIAASPCAAETGGAPALVVAETTCEYAVNPVGIDVLRPRFTWVLDAGRRGTMQQAYRVLVAGSPEKLAADAGDLWDSGKVTSDESVNIAYNGKILSSRQQCYWKVQVWDDRGHASPWSKPANFEMGLLEQSEWRGRRFIAVDLVNPDYVDLAKAYRIPGVRVGSPDQLVSEINAAYGRNTPTIIDVPIPGWV